MLKRFSGVSAIALAVLMQPAGDAQGQLQVEDTFVFTLVGQTPDGNTFTLAGDIFAQVGETANPLDTIRASEPFSPAVNDIFLSSSVTQLTENTGRFDFSVFTDTPTTRFIELGTTVEGSFLNAIAVTLGSPFINGPGLNIPGIVDFTSSQITTTNIAGATNDFAFLQVANDIVVDGGAFSITFAIPDANGNADPTIDAALFGLTRLDGTIGFEIDPALVPEPTSLALLSAGGLLLYRRRRQR